MDEERQKDEGVEEEERKKESEERNKERKSDESAETEERDKESEKERRRKQEGENTKEEEGEPKIGESKLGDAIMQNENGGEKEKTRVKGWYKTPARRGRRQYRSRCRPNLQAAAMEI